jgi:hypothetical protein
MTIILACTIIGFMIGFIYVAAQRKIKPGPLLSAGLVGLLSAAVWKFLREVQKRKR